MVTFVPTFVERDVLSCFDFTCRTDGGEPTRLMSQTKRREGVT